MSSAFRHPSYGSSSGLLTFGVKWLIIINVAIFLIQFFAFHFLGIQFQFLKLIPTQTVTGSIWQPFTYMFLHDVGGVMHILLNMLSLFFTGPMLESHWGTPRFLKFYLLCGVGAGVCVIIASYLAGVESIPTIGCSGAIFGILIAYAVLFPDILFFGIIKAKWFVLILGAINLLDYIAARNAGVSHVAHLGGMLVGWLLIKFGFLKRGGADPFAWIEKQYREWKLSRARRKFEVYMKKQSGPRGRIH